MYFVAAFFLVLIINIIPLFMPSTWSVLTFFAVRHDDMSIVVLALVGAVAATCGRLILASLSRVVIRHKFLSDAKRKNIDAIKNYLEKKRALLFGIIFLYSLSPLPSNQLFIAYGLTDLKLKSAAIPFFLGRVVSYFTIISALNAAVDRYAPEVQQESFVWYFLFMQVMTIASVYIFTQINWKKIVPSYG